MPRPPLPDLSIVLTFLRLAQGWSQAELGEAAGLSPNLVNDYERGRKPLNRERLAHLATFLGLPPDVIDPALACLAATRAAARPAGDAADPFAALRRHIEAVAAQAGRMATDTARSLLTLVTLERESLAARQRAGQLWTRLERRSPEQRLALVEELPRYRTWALCEKVAAESIAAAPNHPRQALELAYLARRIAELAPGSEAWRRRLQGYAWAHVSNARRAGNDLAGAEHAMARAQKLWEAGVPGDPGLLAAAVLVWIEAALRRDQRRFNDALKRIDEALTLDRGELRAEILLSKSRILETLGDPEGSTVVLQEADAFMARNREQRLALDVRFDLLVNLCRLGRAAEAEPRLGEVREMAEWLGEELDLVRVVWLEANVAAGLGRAVAAEAAFQQVRRAFADRGLPHDAALASLELAVLLLEQGRTAEVRALAGEMQRLFKDQDIHREALAALTLFADAARQETATVELARRLVAYFHRARLDPRLELEVENGAGAR